MGYALQIKGIMTVIQWNWRYPIFKHTHPIPPEIDWRWLVSTCFFSIFLTIAHSPKMICARISTHGISRHLRKTRWFLLEPLHQAATVVLFNLAIYAHDFPWLETFTSEDILSSKREVTCCEVQASVSCPVIGIGAGGKVAGQARRCLGLIQLGAGHVTDITDPCGKVRSFGARKILMSL